MIELSGYHCIRNAEVYARPRGCTHDVLLFDRWTVPTREDVLGGLYAMVDALDHRGMLGLEHARALLDKGDLVNALLVTLPEELLLDLRVRHPKARDYVLSLMSLQEHEASERLLRFGCSVGKLLSRMIQEKDHYWYEGVLSSGKRGRLRYRITFNLEDWRLPDRKRFESELLEEAEEHTSYKHKELVSLLDVLYAGLPSRGQMLEVPDISDDVLQTLVERTVKEIDLRMMFTTIYHEGLKAGLRMHDRGESIEDVLEKPPKNETVN